MKTEFKVLMAAMDMKIGGAQTRVLELCKGLQKLGVTVYVASNGGIYEQELHAHGIKHFKVPLAGKNIFDMISAYFSLRSIIIKNDIHLVHAHARIPAFICGLLHGSLDFRFVTTAHNVYSKLLPYKLLSNWGELTLASGDFVRSDLIKTYKLNPDNIIEIMSGIDLDKFKPQVDYSRVIKDFRLSEEKKRVLLISRLDAGKSLAAEKLLDCVEGVYTLNRKIEFVIVGNGTKYEELKNKADELNRKIGKKLVYFIGARSNINELLSSAYVVIGSGRSGIEALASQKPVIMAGDEGYGGLFGEKLAETAINTDFGFKGCEPVTAEKLQADLIKVFRTDISELNAIGEYGRKFVSDNYSVDRTVYDTLVAYQRLLKSSRKYDIMISGFHGSGNHGDETVLKAMLFDLREIQPDLKITVLSSNPEVTAAAHNVESVYRFGYLKILKRIKNTKLLITGGGSLIQDVTSNRSLWHYLFLIKSAIKLHTRTMLYANGIGPLNRPKSRLDAAKVLLKTDLITLRDEESLALLNEIGADTSKAVVTADPIFSLSPQETDVSPLLESLGLKNKKYFVVSLRTWKTIQDGFLNSIQAFCEYIYLRYGYTALFVPTQPDSDSAISEAAASQLRPRGICAGSKLTNDEIISLIARSEFVLGMRLYPVIYALKCGIPILGLAYDPKIEAVFNSFGLLHYCSVDNIELDSLKKYADYCVVNKDIINENFMNISDQARLKSKKTAALAIELAGKDMF